jgi:outer membrane protein
MINFNKTIAILLTIISFAATNKMMAQDTTAVNQNTPAQKSVYSLQQCIEIAFKNNTDVKQAGLLAESARINYNQSKANVLPNLSAGISHTMYNGRSINPYTNAYINEQNTAGSYQLNSSITLWNGSSILNYMKQNRLNYEAGKMDEQNAKDKLTLNIILSYLSVLSAHEQLNIAQKQVEATQKKVDLLTIRNNDGAISPSDLYDMKGQLANDGLTVVSTRNNLDNALQTLTQLMNVPYEAGMKLAAISDGIVIQPYEETVDQVYDNASQRLAVVKSADLKVESASKNIKAIRGQMMPTLSVFGGLYTNYSSAANIQQLTGTTDVPTSNYVTVNGVKSTVYTQQSNYNSLSIGYDTQLKNNFNSAVGIGLQIPLSNNMQIRNKLKLAKVAEMQVKEQAETTRIQLRQAIVQDFVNLNADYTTYKLLLSQVEDFGQSFHAAEIRYENGAISTVDYVIAKNNFDRVQLNLVVAKYNYMLRTKLLDFYQNRTLW